MVNEKHSPENSQLVGAIIHTGKVWLKGRSRVKPKLELRAGRKKTTVVAVASQYKRSALISGRCGEQCSAGVRRRGER